MEITTQLRIPDGWKAELSWLASVTHCRQVDGDPAGVSTL